MQIIDPLIDLLTILYKTSVPQIKKYLQIEKSVKLFSGESLLMDMSNQRILLSNQDVTDKLSVKSSMSNTSLNIKSFDTFIKSLSNSLVRLNHVGISYAVHDIESEILHYKKLTSGTDFEIYEETSGNILSRWFFMGNTTDWQSPLFEIVLTKSTEMESKWYPHFQIDIDTNLSQDELDILLTHCFGRHFVQWKLDIPSYGVVLEMGLLGALSGTKIYLGVGTNLRNTQYHREQILKKWEK